MLTYAGYSDLMVKESNVQGKNGEFNLRKFQFGDNGGRKKGCRDFTLVYPTDPILPNVIYPDNTYKELTIGKTRPQQLPSGEMKPGRSRISSDLNWKDNRNFILASSWDGFTYGGDGRILVKPEDAKNLRLEEYAVGSDGRSAAEGTYDVALFSFAEGNGTFAIERSGDYGVDIYHVSGSDVERTEGSKEEIADWKPVASEDMLVETLKKKKEALEEKLKGVEFELSRYETESTVESPDESVPQ